MSVKFSIDNESYELSHEKFSLFINTLIEALYYHSEIEYVEYDDTTYYNGSSSWYDSKDPDNKIKCDGYMECDTKFPIKKVNEGVSFHMKISEFDFNDMKERMINEDEDETENLSDAHEIMTIIKTITPQSIFNFENVSSLLLKNNRGRNRDHRGSDHIGITLKFYNEWALNNEFSLHQLVTGLHKIKSHHFDYWYELFGGSTTKLKDDVINITCDFDHGS